MKKIIHSAATMGLLACVAVFLGTAAWTLLGEIVPTMIKAALSGDKRALIGVAYFGALIGAALFLIIAVATNTPDKETSSTE